MWQQGSYDNPLEGQKLYEQGLINCTTLTFDLGLTPEPRQHAHCP